MATKVRRPIDEAVVRAWVKRTRAEQGLPVKITDPRIIERVVAILRLSREETRRRELLAQHEGRCAGKANE
jgi:hypothetical protein